MAGALSFSLGAAAATSPTGLGTTGSYSVLGGQTVTNTGPTSLSGDLGVSPGTATTGFPPGKVGGATHAGDEAAGQAQSDLTTAYNDAAGRAPTATVDKDLAGQTLTDGVYASSGPISLSGTLTLDAQGDPDAVFIFQAASTLITASSSNVALVNGALACNVYWQVGSSATLGTTSTFRGTILALTSISVTTGATVEGRALARNGAVTLDNNTFIQPNCTPPAPPSDSAAPTDTDSPSPAPTEETNPAPLPTTEETNPAPLPTDTRAVASRLPETGAGAFVGVMSGLGALLVLVGSVLLISRRARSNSAH
ncbi:ice-binding family protein [Arthrobacter sp.]|uniref:ice-binding family protein n=1 Tax=Arthrobacter sp. TaxID=1667 RepID=UPI003671192B